MLVRPTRCLASLATLLAALLCALTSNLGASEIYRWADDQGRVHFADQRLNERAEAIEVNVQTIEFVDVTALGDFVPTFVQQGHLVMYSTESCGYCRRARNHFVENGIGFIEKDIEKSAVARAEFKRLGGKGVPLLVSDSETMSGFSVAGFNRWYKHTPKRPTR